MEVPVYLFTGFLESGKTVFIKDTITDPNFSNSEKTLVVLCEEGLEEFDDSFNEQNNVTVITVEGEDEVTLEFFEALQTNYSPERVFIEYNGMWDTQEILEMKLPKFWDIVQIITLINCETYESYMNNMRSMLVNHYTDSDMVIFNRCLKEHDKAAFRRSVKAVNRKAQIYFEGEGIDPQDTSELLPFNINADVIKIDDDDFGIWYLDAMDNPMKYNCKTVKFTAMVYIPEDLGGKVFVPGRHAMTCCADDVAFIGFICKSQNTDKLKNRQWISITADIKVEFRKEYEAKGPVLYARKIEAAVKPEEELVYFY